MLPDKFNAVVECCFFISASICNVPSSCKNLRAPNKTWIKSPHELEAEHFYIAFSSLPCM